MKSVTALIFLSLLTSVTSLNVRANSPDLVPSLNQNPAVIDLRASRLLSQIVDELASHKVVLVGESHTEFGNHLNQLTVIKALQPRWKKMAIGLEFVQQPFQSVLDDYIAGSISEAEMLLKTEWYERWRYDFRLYRPIFEFARKNHIPLVALNVQSEVTQVISDKGIDSLPSHLREQIPQEIDKSNAAYNARMESVFLQHTQNGDQNLERFIDVQLAWDETMAQNAANYLLQGKADNMVVLAGSGHVVRSGIPDRLERRLKAKTINILNQPPEDLMEADFVLQSAIAELPKAGRMGIMMRDTQGGVLITEVAKESGSTKAGIKKGDRLISIDKAPITTTQDVKIVMMDKSPEETISVTLRRGKDEDVSVQVKLQ